MREGLKNINGIRGEFQGIFERYGSKSNWNGYPEKTILLRSVQNSGGKIITDHIWFKETKGFAKLGDIKEGAIIKFEARVKKYIKGYQGYREDIESKPINIDYKLSHPTKIRIVGKKLKK